MSSEAIILDWALAPIFAPFLRSSEIGLNDSSPPQLLPSTVTSPDYIFFYFFLVFVLALRLTTAMAIMTATAVLTVTSAMTATVVAAQARDATCLELLVPFFFFLPFFYYTNVYFRTT